MQTKTSTSLAAAAAAALVLTGCTNVMDAVHQVHAESFDSTESAVVGWVGVSAPEWLPADATSIENVATTNETNAVIAFESTDGPIGCEPGARATVPFDGRYGGFADAADLPIEVLWCGPYEVHETDDGWLAWFNATEPGQTPETT